MAKEVLGEFEHHVLLAALRLAENAYSAAIVEELEAVTGREVAPAAVYIALRRLEESGMAVSDMRSPAEGGRSRRYFVPTPRELRGCTIPAAGSRRSGTAWRLDSPMAEVPRPPRFARWWLARLLPRRDRHLALAELEDLYALKAARHGYPVADRWYRGQLLSFPARLWADRTVRAVRVVTRPEIWRSTMSLDSIIRDLKYAMRRLGRAPGFSIVAVVSLALGIGANTAMFSIVNAVVFADPPFTDSETLVELYTSDSGARSTAPGRSQTTTI